MSNAINFGDAIILSAASFLFGNMDIWIYTLVVFVVMDYITGLSAAYIQKQLHSKIGFRGIVKKVLYFVVVVVAHLLDVVTNMGGVLRSAVIGFLLANEGLSIIENCSKADLPIPQKLISALHLLRQGEDKNEKK